MSTRKIVLGTMAGITVGALGGYLVASGKGAKIVSQVKDLGEGYMNQFKSKVDTTVDSAKEKYNSFMDNAEDLAQKGKAKYENTKKEIKNDLNQLSS